MKGTVLDEPTVHIWLKQFSAADQIYAATLVSLIRLISGDQFRREITSLLDQRLNAGPCPIAVYNESERKKWKGKPNRLFPEKACANPERKGAKVNRAVGKVGPPLVPRQRYIAEETGSEGIVANILTQFHRSNRSDILLSPGPDVIRDKCVRRFILVTDFIGSGDRIINYINAAWRISSVRSWWSRREAKGLKFEVIAYAGTHEGVAQVERHPCNPQVSLVARCPTIRSIFPPAQATVMNELCQRYAPQGSPPLGHGDVGVLLAFDHGMPNNAPAMLWKSSRHWSALVPARSATSVTSPFHAARSEEQERGRLEATARAAAAGPPLAPVNLEAIVLSALRRSPRHSDAISGRLGLDVSQVLDTLAQLKKWGWITDRHQLTERGRLVAERFIRQNKNKSLPSLNSDLYFPNALRAPKDV